MSVDYTFDTLSVLKEAKEIISDEDSWTKGASARLADGTPAPVWDWFSCEFCTLGVLARAGGAYRPDAPVTELAVKAVKEANSIDFIAKWNDDPDTTHNDVINAFDKAIKMVEERLMV